MAMTREEFRKAVDGYWNWAGEHDTEAGWWYSLEEYAATERGKAQRKEREERGQCIHAGVFAGPKEKYEGQENPVERCPHCRQYVQVSEL